MKKFSPRALIDTFAPFVQWLPELKNPATLRADIIAGITVALVLIPQSMAYAQLAGLPAYFGLYAAFMPPMVAAIFGSSRQLATGPVAVVSLLSAAALEPLATAGSEAFILYAVLLALIVGLFQMALGLLRLGVLVNFLSHPVVLGFTNAAAIIIATSQLGKIFGVNVAKATHHYETVWNTVVIAYSQTHWPTFLMAVLAFGTMILLKKLGPRLPGVLIAVALTTILSYVFDFQEVQSIKLEQIADEGVRETIQAKLNLEKSLERYNSRIKVATDRYEKAAKRYGEDDSRTLSAQLKLESQKRRRERFVQNIEGDVKRLNSLRFLAVESGVGEKLMYYPEGEVPEDARAKESIWHISGMDEAGELTLNAGGKVVGRVPEGLPSFKVPTLDWNALGQLTVAAITIALIGFMEAISIAKAMAARTRQRLDVNQELVGQGLSNIVGSFFQSYAVSGSFSRSAVNIGAGAITGFSSVVTTVVVVVTLLWLTPLLYHLPQATLAAVIMMAVIGLVNFRALVHTWHVHREDGIVAIITFVLTLAFAPHLENAIVIGVILSLALFLYRSMEPRMAVLGRHPDGSLRDAAIYGLQTCDNVAIVRFDGSLYFANISYFEDTILKMAAKQPELKYIIVDGPGINEIDASGEEMLTELVERLQKGGIEVYFSRFKKQVMDVLRNSGFVERLGKDRFFRQNEMALQQAWTQLGAEHEVDCPLNVVCAIQRAEDRGEGQPAPAS